MHNNLSILAVIPARGGSKGVPRKNIRAIAGKPLIAWTIQEARQSKYIDSLIVTTEDEEIATIALNYGAEVPFLRPMHLAQDHSTSADTVYHTVDTLAKEFNRQYDLLLLLQPTSPMRTAEHIDEAIELFVKYPMEHDSLISVCKLEHPVYWNRRISEDNFLNDFLVYNKQESFQRQNFEELYRLNGAIYLISTEKFMKFKQFETSSTIAYVMDSRSSIDIDTSDDFEIAQYFLRTFSRSMSNSI